MRIVIFDEASRSRAATTIANWPLDGRRWVAEFKEADQTRRTVQNNLLWRWNSEIQAFMETHHGQIASAEEWHDIFCRKLMPTEGKTIKTPDGELYETGRWRSSKSGVREMSEYLNKLDAYCACMGLMLSHPDDLYRQAMSGRAA